MTMTEKLYSQLHTYLHQCELRKVRNLFLNQGLSVNHRYADGSSPIHIAAEKGAYAIVQLLLGLGVNVNCKNQHGQTPLFLAVQKSHEDIARVIIRRGCSVNLTDSQQRTALHMACAEGLTQIVQILLEEGARVKMQDKWGRTPLHTTLMGALGISHNQGSIEKFVDVVQLLVQQGCDVNAADHQGATPLFLTVAAGDKCTPIALFLLAKGADPNKPGRHKLTPLKLASLKGYLDMCKLLLYENCDVEIGRDQTIRGKSALQTAAEKGFIHIVKLLVASGCQLHLEQWLYMSDHMPSGSNGTANENEESMMEYLKDLASHPQSLKQLCRGIVRRHWRRRLNAHVMKLQYPEILKNYLRLKDELMSTERSVAKVEYLKS